MKFCSVQRVLLFHATTFRRRSVVKEAATSLTLDDVEGESGK
ncbi:hypothetical protein HDF13_001434 [Edaphobacter lichenicola]|uniref:Uncharacterized protein n=1 Tax=Tunturiibacter gelidiferens TaxID=3069689 RepID=A0ACC5NXD2_9BACT|nr:hypothetical protein [Edaphobacter lichenicola]